MALLVLLPLIAGAVLAGTRIAGVPGGGPVEGAAAPAAPDSPGAAVPGGWTGTSSAAGIEVAALQATRGHVNAAAGQIGFLSMGLGQEADGIGRLHDGSKELADGMILVQNGTGQLGKGAQALADAVNGATGNVSLAAVAAGQVDGAIDRARDSLRASTDPAAADAIADLDTLQRQLATVDFAGLDAKLSELRTGVNDVATQLNSPNGDFRNGVWQATEGTKKLRDGLGELRDGHGRLQTMAGDVDREVNAARSAAPVPTAAQLEAAGLAPAAGDVTAGGFGELGVSPAAAFLAAALAVAAGAALVLVPAGTRPGSRVAAVAAGAGRLPHVLLTAAGVIAVGAAALVGLLMSGDAAATLPGLPEAPAGAEGAAAGVAPQAIALAGAVLVLAAGAGAAGAAAVVRLFGRVAGSVIALVGLAAQVAFVGWAWRAALDGTAAVPAWLAVLSGLMPLHYPMAAFSSLGTGDSGGLVLAGAVLGAVLVLGLVLAGVAGRGTASTTPST